MTPEFQKTELSALEEYLNAAPLPGGRTPVQIEAELDRNRAKVIGDVLKPLLTQYLAKSTSTDEFKFQIDSASRQTNYWGFRGIKGQMFFNQLANNVEELSKSNNKLGDELDDQLRTAIRDPGNEENAASSLRNFEKYVTTPWPPCPIKEETLSSAPYKA